MSNAQKFIRQRERAALQPRKKFSLNPLKFLRSRVLTSVDEYAEIETEIWLRANAFLSVGLVASGFLLLGAGQVFAFIIAFVWALWTVISIALNRAKNTLVPFTKISQPIFALVAPFLIYLCLGDFIALGYPAFVGLNLLIVIIYQRHRLAHWVGINLCLWLAGILLDLLILTPRPQPGWFPPLWIASTFLILVSLSSYMMYCIVDMHNRALDLLSTEQKILKNLVVSDPLTGIFNRRHFFELATQISAQAERYAHVYSVLVFDLDNFREVNNKLGHPTGDYVLREFVRIVQASIRSADIFARYGGEEFILLMPETALAPASEVAERLRIVISSQPIRERIITASIGVAHFQPRTGDTLEQTVERADQALLRAKSGGKNRVVADGQ